MFPSLSSSLALHPLTHLPRCYSLPLRLCVRAFVCMYVYVWMVFFHAAFGHWEIHTHTQRIRTTAQSERHTASQLHPLRPTAALFHKQHTTLQKHRCEHRTYKNRMCPSHRESASRTVGACRTLPLERDNLCTLATAPEKRNSVAAAVAPKNSFGRAHTHISMHVRTHKTQHSTNARTHTCVALPPERNRATVARTQSPDGKHTTQPSVSSRTRALILASYTHAHTIRQIRARSLSLSHSHSFLAAYPLSTGVLARLKPISFLLSLVWVFTLLPPAFVRPFVSLCTEDIP